MKTAKISAILVVLICLIICPVSRAQPLGTAITYNGMLINNDGLAEGFYDFAFTLYDAIDPNTRTQIGNTLRMNEFNVVNGLFQAELDFGSGDPNVFNGDARWIETIAWPSGSNATESNVMYLFQEIKPVPYTLLNRGIFVDKDRNVGIGTSSPNEKLHVAGRAQFDLHGGRIHMSTPGGWPGIIAFSPNGHRREVIIDDVSIRLLTSDSSSAAPGQNGISIRENGNVGINMAAPSYKLDVNGTIRGDNISPSDARMKKDIETIDNALKRVTSLRGANFRWADEEKEDDLQIGVIAQEVEAVFPEVVSTDNEGYKSVAYGKLVAPLIEAIKELKAENDLLKQKVEALEKKLR